LRSTPAAGYTLPMQKNRGMIVGIIIAIIGILIFFSYMGVFRSDERPFNLSLKQALKLPCGLRLYAPKKNATVKFPMTVRGYANGCGWEPTLDGRLGTLDIVGENGVYFGTYALKAQGDISRPPYYFEGVVSPQLPYTATTGNFIFTPNTPVGKVITIPVTFQ
jgi:hypothetical protein